MGKTKTKKDPPSGSNPKELYQLNAGLKFGE